MSDGALSQDEIDALMSGSSAGGFDFAEPSGVSGGGELSESEKQDFLKLINNITGAQAATLTGMMGKTIDIKQPSVEVVDGSSVAFSISGSFIRVKSSFTEGLSGYHVYLIPENVAKTIAALLTGLEQVDLDDAALSAVSEAINTIAGSALTTFGDKKNMTIMTEPAAADLKSSSDSDIQSGSLVKLSFPISIEGEEPAEFYELFDIPVVRELVQSEQAQTNDVDNLLSGLGMPSSPPPSSGGSGMQIPMGNMGGGMGFSQPQQGGGMMSQSHQNINVQNVQYPPLTGSNMDIEHGNISLLMDVYMEMTVELGRTKKPIREILSMGEGTIIELDKLAGEPVDILVNHKLIANGEVVVIDENFGVRVTKIVSPNAGLSDLS